MCLLRPLVLFLILMPIILNSRPIESELSQKVKRALYINESDELDLEDYLTNAVNTPITCAKGFRADHQGKCRRLLKDPKLKETQNSITLEERVYVIYRCKKGYKQDFKGICRRIFNKK